MFRIKENSEGDTARYYVTKDGRAVKLVENESQNIKLPGIKPLVAEQDIKEIFYKLFDRQAIKAFGIDHVNYIELRKTRPRDLPIQAKSSIVATISPCQDTNGPIDLIPIDQGLFDHPDIRPIMSREEANQAFHMLYHSQHAGPPKTKSRHDLVMDALPHVNHVNPNLPEHHRSSHARKWATSTIKSRHNPHLPETTTSPRAHRPHMMSHHDEREALGYHDDVTSLKAQMHALEQRLHNEAQALAKTHTLDRHNYLRKGQSYLPLEFVFRAAGKVWARSRLSHAMTRWKGYVEVDRLMQIKAQEDVEQHAPQAICIQKMYRGMKGRERYKHWNEVYQKLYEMVRSLGQLLTRRAFVKLKSNVQAQQFMDQRRGQAVVRIQATWRGFRYGRCPVRYIRCKGLLIHLRTLGGGQLFKIHRISLAKKDKEGLNRILNLAMSSMKPLKALPTQAMIKASSIFVQQCQEKLKLDREKRVAKAAGQKKTIKIAMYHQTSKSSFRDFLPSSTSIKSPSTTAEAGVPPPKSPEVIRKPGTKALSAAVIPAPGTTRSSLLRRQSTQDKRQHNAASQMMKKRESSNSVFGQKAATPEEIEELLVAISPESADWQRVQKLRQEKLEKGQARQRAKAEASEREIMLREDHHSHQEQQRFKEMQKKAEREAKELEKLRLLGKSTSLPGSSGAAAIVSKSVGDQSQRTIYQEFQVGEKTFIARVWPVLSARGAEIKENLWILSTSEQLLAERRQAYFLASLRRSQAEKTLDQAILQLRTLKVKMAIERKEKEASVAASEAHYQEAVAVEKMIAKEVRNVLSSYVKALSTALHVIKPIKINFPADHHSLGLIIAAVQDWGALAATKFVKANQVGYIEALQCFAYLDEKQDVMAKDVSYWLCEASKATHLTILEALTSRCALQFQIFESPVASTPIYSTVVEENVVTLLLGRQPFSSFLYRKAREAAEMASSSSYKQQRRRLAAQYNATVVVSVAREGEGPDNNNAKAMEKTPSLGSNGSLCPTVIEVKEYQTLLKVLMNRLKHQDKPEAERVSFFLESVVPGAEEEEECMLVREGPYFEWIIVGDSDGERGNDAQQQLKGENTFKICVKPRGPQNTWLEISRMRGDSIETRSVQVKDKEIASHFLIGLVLLTQDLCFNCKSRTATVVGQSKRMLCPSCQVLLKELVLSELPTSSQIRRKLLPPYIREAFGSPSTCSSPLTFSHSSTKAVSIDTTTGSSNSSPTKKSREELVNMKRDSSSLSSSASSKSSTTLSSRKKSSTGSSGSTTHRPQTADDATIISKKKLTPHYQSSASASSFSSTNNTITRPKSSSTSAASSSVSSLSSGHRKSRSLPLLDSLQAEVATNLLRRKNPTTEGCDDSR